LNFVHGFLFGGCKLKEVCASAQQVAWIGLVIILSCTAAGPPHTTPHPVEKAEPALRATVSVGVEAPLEGLDALAINARIAAAIRARKLPGCVVAIGRGQDRLWIQAFGHRALQPVPQVMRVDTVFDLASLTKPVVTATSVMLLYDRGQLELDAPVARYMPAFERADKQRISLRQLLTHTSGLPAVLPRSKFERPRPQALQQLYDVPLGAAPGKQFVYSDLGFIVLGELVAQVSGQTLDRFAHDNIFAPLQMYDTGFLPSQALRLRAAPTEQRNLRWMQGEVHDPLSYRLGGVAGNAGVFATASDLAKFSRMLLGHGALNDLQFLSPSAVREMTRAVPVPSGIRTLGWDMRSTYSRQRGMTLSDGAFGHGGFTGTALWIDPQRDMFFIFLSNRVHPEGGGAVQELIRDIIDIAARSNTLHASESKRQSVITGLDVLTEHDFNVLKSARIGLVTNRSARNRAGQPAFEVLQSARGASLMAVFTPEHGLDGDKEGKVTDRTLAHTPVYSLFGARRKPSAEQLSRVDTLVVDLQDVGTRYYTYGSTLRLLLEVAAELHLRIIVLDRPNPINGVTVEGPILRDTSTFVNYHPLPVRHGLTLGELAWLLNRERRIGARLYVVRMRGWQRDTLYSETGLSWWPPSPNMPTPEQPLYYPATGLLEGTNVTVGRGTTRPFRVVGAPWLDRNAVAHALTQSQLPGVIFRPTMFTPTASRYRGELCHAVELVITDPRGFRPIETGLRIAQVLRQQHPQTWDTQRLVRLIGDASVVEQTLQERPLARIHSHWQPALRAFIKRREQYLLYR